jgi:hypothetical protein
VFVATLHRLFVSGSDRDCSVWMEDYDIAGAQGLGLHHFYRAVAWLGEEIEDKRADALAPRCVKDAIEEKLHAGMEAVAARSRSAATGATRASRVDWLVRTDVAPNVAALFRAPHVALPPRARRLAPAKAAPPSSFAKKRAPPKSERRGRPRA